MPDAQLPDAQLPDAQLRFDLTKQRSLAEAVYPANSSIARLAVPNVSTSTPIRCKNAV